MKIFFRGAPLSASLATWLLQVPCCLSTPEVEAKVLQELQSLGLAASAKNPVSAAADLRRPWRSGVPAGCCEGVLSPACSPSSLVHMSNVRACVDSVFCDF